MDQLFWERVVSIVFVLFVIRFSKGVAVNEEIPALFSFGDSILDTGTNNILITPTKANYPPYGIDFPGRIPTGRFCNGRTPSDLIAEGLGIKDTLPPYLGSNLSPQDLATGVCFASAGSGIDDLTAQINVVLSQPRQLEMYKEYIRKVTEIFGQEPAGEIISKSVYLISAGNNDVANTYSTRLAPTTPFPEYVARLMETESIFFKSLYELGARRVWVLSTLPLGCLPGLRTPTEGQSRECSVQENDLAQQFNAQLSLAVDSTRASLPDYDIRFIDVYNLLFNLIQNPQPAGFEDAAHACCGTEPSGASGICNIAASVCPNPSTHVFWDIFHPTERAYKFLVSSILKSQPASNSSSVSSTLHY